METKSHNRKHGNSQHVHSTCARGKTPWVDTEEEERTRSLWDALGSSSFIPAPLTMTYQPAEHKQFSSTHVWDRRTAPWYEGEAGITLGRRRVKEPILRVESIQRTISSTEMFGASIVLKTILAFWYTLCIDVSQPEVPERLNYLQHSADTFNGFALSSSIFYHWGHPNNFSSMNL